MARIKITDLGWIENIHKETAGVILEKWASLKESKARLYEHPLKLPDWGGTYADLKQVDLSDVRGADNKAAAQGERRKEENMRHYAEMNQEYRDYKRSKLSLPLEKRAEDMSIAELVWFGVTGSAEIPEDAKKEIAERQLRFFKDNPGVMYANPICYKDVLPPAIGKLDETLATTSMRRMCHTLALNLVSGDKFSR
jgi:hypothetical protein